MLNKKLTLFTLDLSYHLRELGLTAINGDVDGGAVAYLEQVFGAPWGFAGATGLWGAKRELVVAAGLVEECGLGLGYGLLL